MEIEDFAAARNRVDTRHAKNDLPCFAPFYSLSTEVELRSEEFLLAVRESAVSPTRAAYQQHRAALHRFLMRRLRHRETAQDVAQEVYLRLLRVEDREVIRDPLAFLYRLAMNLIYELRLRRRRDPILFDSETTQDLSELLPAGPAADLSEPLCAEAELTRVLTSLAPTVRAVFVLRKRDGMSDREIAAELGLSVHTVKKYLTQAVAQCRQVIAAEPP